MPTLTTLPNPAEEPNRDESAELGGMSRARFDAARRRLEERKAPQHRPDVLAADAIIELAREDNPVTRFLQGRNARESSMVTYRYNLRTVQRRLAESGFEHGDESTPAEEFPWHLVGPSEATAFAQHVAVEYPNVHSAGTITTVLRTLLKECARVGLISPRRREQVLESLPVPAIPPNRAGREISDEEIALLFEACEAGRPFMAARDAAMLAVALSTGMRSCELVDLDLADVDFADGSLRIRRTKGGRSHKSWLHDAVSPIVEAWLNERGTYPGPLFTSKSGSRLSTRTILGRVRMLCQRAGLKRATPHDFRRTCITKLLRNGTDPFVVARVVGHKKVSTTLLYDRRTEMEDREAVQALPFEDLGRARRRRGGDRR